MHDPLITSLCQPEYLLRILRRHTRKLTHSPKETHRGTVTKGFAHSARIRSCATCAAVGSVRGRISLAVVELLMGSLRATLHKNPQHCARQEYARRSRAGNVRSGSGSFETVFGGGDAFDFLAAVLSVKGRLASMLRETCRRLGISLYVLLINFGVRFLALAQFVEASRVTQLRADQANAFWGEAVV